MPYPSAADLVADSTIMELTTLPADQQETLRQAAIVAIEEFTGQSFETWTGTLTVDGTGDTVLYLPRRLETLTAIAANGSGLVLSDVVLSPQGDRLHVNEEALVGNYYTRALRAISPSEYMAFPYGHGRVSVTGTWGWSTTPSNVVRAILKDMEDTALADASALNNTIRAYRKLGLADISQGDLNASFGFASYALSDEVIGLLRPYIWTSRVGARA
jgi:hypothetical protein